LPDAQVQAQLDPRTEYPQLRISRQVHGNTRLSIISYEFSQGADCATLEKAALTFKGLIGEGAWVARGEGEKQKKESIADFRAAMQWLQQQAEGVVSRQRYKGLGEMNPDQLWETTMNPEVRRLLRVQIEDAIEADRVFTTLMGDEVEPRRAFIEENALKVVNIDI
jgi:DNA gyrase subunit B